MGDTIISGMRTISGVVTGIQRLSRYGSDYSKDATARLKWFDYYHDHGCNARLTCNHFDISPQTFYRWKRRYDPRYLKSLESHSCKPRHMRQPMYSPDLVAAVLKIREENPRWGKTKLALLLKERGQETSASTVGRIMQWLKDRGLLKEPLPNHISTRKRLRPRPYGIRKPKGYIANAPGDIVQLDTLDVRPLPGVIFKHFTAHDVVSKWNVLGIYRQATARTATQFLDRIEAMMPFGVKALQVDGGAEFQSLFEEECQRRGIRLYVLPPRSPKLNGGVERVHRTHTEEFYEVTDSTFEIEDLNNDLLRWEGIYNTIRPHQALGYLTPLQFLQQQSNSQEGGRVLLRY
jgi:transposase InsO family protein